MAAWRFVFLAFTPLIFRWPIKRQGHPHHVTKHAFLDPLLGFFIYPFPWFIFAYEFVGRKNRSVAPC